MQNMGGLRRYMPVTFWTFVIASFANAGLIPFAGFWSKDEIILSAWITHDISVPVGKFLAIVGLVTAFFTAFYMFRVVFLVFTGEPRYNPAVIRPHESPPSMAIPLVLLAIPSAILGLWIGLPPDAGRIHTFLEPVFAAPAATAEGEQAAALYQVDESTTAPVGLAAKVGDNQGGEEHVSLQTTLTFAGLSTAAVLAGIFVAWMVYVRGAIARPEAHPSALYQFLRDKWRWDELYNNAIVTPLRELAYGLWQVVDTRIIDGAVNGVGYGIGAASERLRRVQTGLVTNYALAIALGMVVLLGIYLGISSSLFR
jgi:NADH-quinone oxidoreductase subunit L